MNVLTFLNVMKKDIKRVTETYSLENAENNTLWVPQRQLIHLNTVPTSKAEREKSRRSHGKIIRARGSNF